MNMTLGVVTMLWTQAGAPYFFPREKGLECGSALTCQGTAVLINNKFVTLAYARPVFLMSIRFMQPFCTCMQQKKVSITLYKVEGVLRKFKIWLWHVILQFTVPCLLLHIGNKHKCWTHHGFTYTDMTSTSSDGQMFLLGLHKPCRCKCLKPVSCPYPANGALVLPTQSI